MRTRIVSCAIGVYWAMLSMNDADAEGCIPIALPSGATDVRVPSDLKISRTNSRDTITPSGYWLYHSGKNLMLSGPAEFCLKQDIVRDVDILAKLIGEPGGYGPLVEMSNSDITLDLNGHALRSNRAGLAIQANVGGYKNEKVTKNFVFKNGMIEIGGVGVEITGWQYMNSSANYIPGPDEIRVAENWYGVGFREFDESNVILENLTIKSGGMAAYLVGRKNIIRNCHIEVDGHEAIALFGAGNRLINNEIIVRRTIPAPRRPNQPPAQLALGFYYEEHAPIWIRDAPGLIIRGNKITVRGLFPAEEAILLINSPNVVIEDNEVNGVKKLYRALDAQSSARVHNNRKRFGKWPED